LREAISDYSPDLVQTHNVKSHFIFRLTGLDNVYPWIGFHHGYTSTDLKMELYNRLDRWSLPRARRVVTVCKPFAEQIVRRGVRRERVTVLHNSVRSLEHSCPDRTSGLREALRILKDEPVLLNIGRFSKEKGHADLVTAVQELRRIYERPFKVVLVGDGPERGSVLQLIRAFGMESAFYFAGQVSNVEPFYAIASVVVLPSHSEGSPNVLLEAMARGLPVIATAVGGVPEIIDDGVNGLLVPAGATKAMAGAISDLLIHPVRAARLGSAARSRVEQFTPEAYRRSMIKIYLEVLGPAATK
jgi:glycosyltransferase involved in cell wall biosynthesis